MHGGKDISPLVDDIYLAALDSEQWPHVLQRLAEVFGSSSAHLSVDNRIGTGGKIISFGTDPAYAQSYADYYGTCNVLWHRIVQRSLRGVVTNRIVMPKEELRNSEFYNDYLRPQDGDEILCWIGLQQMDRATNFTLWRSERFGPWDTKHMKAFAKLTPHLRRALQVNQRIGELRLMHDFVTEALHRLDHGVIVLTAQARVCFANRVAKAILDDAGGVRMEHERLAARTASDTSALRRLIAGAVQDSVGGSLVISRDARPSLLLLIIPKKAESCPLIGDPSGAIIFIKDLEQPANPSLTAFTEHFGLTPAQAALAHELIKGDGVTAAAARLGISRATVRTHLVHIFQKTATRRQAELVRLMLEWSNEPAAMTSDLAWSSE